MNITQALNVALPELPARLISERPPRVHPDVVFRDHVEDGIPVVRAFVPGVASMFVFPPESWRLIQLFDGQRSYAEIGELYSAETGADYSEEIVRDFAAGIEALNFWYQTPQEKNVKLMQKTADERRRLQKKTNWGDLSQITFPAVNPDPFLGWLYPKISFMYKPWCVVLTLVAFALTAGIFVVHWSEVGRDTIEFYNFADKSWFDVASFWIIASVLLCIHEIGHGLTVKHYKAPVPAMGFLLIYLTPGFYTDTTAGEVKGDRFQRLMIAVAGVWAELVICALVTPIWWLTPPNTPAHDFAYTIILFTGVAVVFINWNPLMKLDGYYIVCDLIGISDLKEASTLYLSSWIKRNIWRLPVVVPFVPQRRRPGYVVYAILSGLYSYSVLYFFAGFMGNIARNFSADWGFLLEYVTAFMIFRGRIRTLWNFMKFLYLDKKDRLARWFSPSRKFAVLAAAIIFSFLPIWHETAVGRFVVEPAKVAVLRASVPGVVAAVYADEGQPIQQGAPLLLLRNVVLTSKAARSRSDFEMAQAKAQLALLHYADFGSASADRERLGQQTSELNAEVAELSLSSPISGTVLTPRLSDKLGSYIPAGSELAEVADLSQVRARIYVSEFDMYKFTSNSPARFEVDGFLRKHNARIVSIAPVSSDIAPGLIDLTKYKGERPPRFYVFELIGDNKGGSMQPGMAGTARVYGARRSLAALACRTVWEFAGRKIW
jgi:putative peptide zinc metalloprotease protein